MTTCTEVLVIGVMGVTREIILKSSEKVESGKHLIVLLEYCDEITSAKGKTAFGMHVAELRKCP